MEKNWKLWRNVRQYYTEESDDYAEKTPDYAEISKINKVVPLAFSNVFTAPFNNMRTLQFEAQPTNGFFAAVNQMFGGSSQLPATAEHCFGIWILLNDLITARSTVVGSWEESPNTWLTVAKNTFVGWALNVRVRMLLKSAVNTR